MLIDCPSSTHWAGETYTQQQLPITHRARERLDLQLQGKDGGDELKTLRAGHKPTMYPALGSSVALLMTKKLNTRFLVRLKSMSPLKKGIRRDGSGWQPGVIKGGTMTTPMEWGPLRKPAYLIGGIG